MTAPLKLAFFGGGQSGLPPCYFHLVVVVWSFFFFLGGCGVEFFFFFWVVVVWSYPEHSHKLIEPRNDRNYFESIYFTYPLACGGYMGDYQGVGGHK